MTLQSKNDAALNQAQRRHDNELPDDYDPYAICPECGFTCSAIDARHEHLGLCPNCDAPLESSE